jgi:dolichyl-phosphate beta-glucosyltransferase
MQVIVIPVYNEESRFNLECWREVTTRIHLCHWVFVNDGSTDQTLKILELLQGKNVSIVTYEENRGKGEAVRAGILFALNSTSCNAAKYIGYLDSDGAFSVPDVERVILLADSLFSLESNFDVLIASRVKLAGRQIERSFFRHYLGRVISTLICLGWKNSPYDTQSGFKIFYVSEVFIDSVNNSFATSWFFDIELLIRIEKLGGRNTWETPLMSWVEVGKSSIKKSNYFKIIQEIIRIKCIVRKHAKGRKFKNGFN